HRLAVDEESVQAPLGHGRPGTRMGNEDELSQPECGGAHRAVVVHREEEELPLPGREARPTGDPEATIAHLATRLTQRHERADVAAKLALHLDGHQRADRALRARPAGTAGPGSASGKVSVAAASRSIAPGGRTRPASFRNFASISAGAGKFSGSPRGCSMRASIDRPSRRAIRTHDAQARG